MDVTPTPDDVDPGRLAPVRPVVAYPLPPVTGYPPPPARAIADIANYIELRRNHKRLHWALGYRTPDEVENEWYATQQAA